MDSIAGVTGNQCERDLCLLQVDLDLAGIHFTPVLKQPEISLTIAAPIPVEGFSALS
jgi:hypothetical protein